MYVFGRWDSAEEVEDLEMPCEPAGYGAIATGSILSRKELWRTFVHSAVVMDWIENGYRLPWTESAPLSKELANAPPLMSTAILFRRWSPRCWQQTLSHCCHQAKGLRW